MAVVVITLDEAIKTYIDRREREKAKRATIENASCLLRRFSKFMGACNVSQIDPLDVSAFVLGAPGRPGLMEPHVGRRGRVIPGVKGQTANKYVDILSVFFQFCERRHWTQQDLLSDLRMANGRINRVDETVTEMVHLTPEQMYAAIDAARWPRDRMMLALACQTGARESELMRVKLGDLKLDIDKLTIWRTKVKGAEQKPADLPIFPDLYAELWPWLDHYAAFMSTQMQLDIPMTAQTMIRDHPDWYLTPSHRTIPVYGKPGERRLVKYLPNRRYSNPDYALKLALGKIGIVLPHGQAVHAIRRSVAEQIVDVTDDIEVAQAQLGHSSSDTTLNYLRRNRLEEKRDKALTGGFMSRPAAAGVASLDERRRARP